MRLRSIGRRSERGAALVEFAVVMPLLILLLFGIMEAGWLFAQLTETRNAAREGARLAVVDFGSASQVAQETCARANLSAGGATVNISTSGDVTDPIGDPSANVTVEFIKPYESLTGLFDPIFSGTPLDSTVTMRIERPLTQLSGSTSEVCS
jgi:Flp pilus assembly protein TadG